MSIQILDGFQVNVAKPIDSRIVASGSDARNAIPYKYHGLRVFDISNNIPYVWNGSAWVSENSGSVTGTGQIDHVAFFNDSNILDSSTETFFLRRQDNQYIGVGTTQDFQPEELFHVDGNIKSSGNFIGNGSQLTNLSASSISSGTLALSRLANGSTNGWLLAASTGSPVYINPNTLSVANSINASKILSIPDSQNIDYKITFTGGGAGNKDLFIQNLSYNPSTSTISGSTLILSNSIKLAAGSVTAPAFTFTGDNNTGIYNPGANQLGFSINGVETMKLESNAVTFGAQSSFYPRIRINSTSSATTPSFTWWGNDQTGIFRPASNVVAISTGAPGVERARFADAGVSIGIGTPIKAMYVGKIRFTKTGSTTGSVTVLNGSDYNGASYTVSGSYNPTTVTAQVNFPTAMPTSNIIVVCHVDSSDSNHYPWTVICSNRNTGYITLNCLQQNASAWNSGSVDGSFVAYCV